MLERGALDQRTPATPARLIFFPLPKKPPPPVQPLLDIGQLLLPLAYTGSFVMFAHHFYRAERAQRSARWAVRLLHLTLVGHLVYLVGIGLVAGSFPLASKAEFLSVLALSIASVYAITERGEDEAYTGVFFLGMVATFQAAASLLMEPPGVSHPILLENPIYGVHVIFTVLGFAALTVGAIDALMYVLLSRQLKSRELGLFFRRLPPLMKLENMSRFATTAGLVLLGLGFLLGHLVGVVAAPEGFDPWDPKIILIDVAWLLYLVVFVGGKVRGLSGLRAAYVVLVGYLAMMATMVLTNVLLRSFHSFQP